MDAIVTDLVGDVGEFGGGRRSARKTTWPRDRLSTFFDVNDPVVWYRRAKKLIPLIAIRASPT